MKVEKYVKNISKHTKNNEKYTKIILTFSVHDANVNIVNDYKNERRKGIWENGSLTCRWI